MSTIVKTRLVKIGNSRGIRIPKLLVEQVGLTDDIELEVQERALVIRSVQHPRAGWEAQFAAMAEQGDDQPLDTTRAELTTWDAEEWEW